MPPDAPTPVARVGTITVPKFPPQFTVSALTADPPAVPSGGTTMLIWTGTPPSATAPASYTISYNPGTGPVTEPVGTTGPYTSVPLTQTPVVVFTLEVSITVAGQDAPLVVQRQATVQVDVPPPVIQQFSGEILSGAGEIQLRLDVGDPVRRGRRDHGVRRTLFNPSGSWTVTPTAQAPLPSSYTLTATNAAGSAARRVTLGWGASGPPSRSGTARRPWPSRPTAPAPSSSTRPTMPARSRCSTPGRLQVDRHVHPGRKSTPEAIAFTPDGARAFVVNTDDNTVTVLDATTDPPTVVGGPSRSGTCPRPCHRRHARRHAGLRRPP